MRILRQAGLLYPVPSAIWNPVGPHAPPGVGQLFAFHTAAAYWAMSDLPISGGWHGEPVPDAAPAPIQAALPPPLPATPQAPAWRNYLRAIYAGCRIALLGRPSLQGLRLGPGVFWAVLATSL